MKTIFLKDCEQKREWFVIDAAGKPLGRVAAKAAAILRGKEKASYTPNQEMGDYVIIINADKVAVSGNKASDKLYRHYTGFVRGLRSYTFEKLIEKNPTEPLVRTINGMLPNNRLGRKVAANLKVYAGSEHPHATQNPKVVEL
ncbi:50S ribosomal protein L13 [Treponema saccharophilum]|jgi:large subunit ribosomal protein L13|uniref:Large ribosomal subunit protein uL13 n=1 Tax=Treponema saccharophilum DSM 2985 TaxID=907348 RepID=H7EHJ1_9SPIR|nr:50S ribosomal protein L13 [Treponema saccharophilum]EIC02937.1 LSU ribosomal protein L13P [Treponema saccharophilum DSM 2985]BDC95465.1 50S ribosomal protein L13 [Treponema saccharophilum]